MAGVNSDSELFSPRMIGGELAHGRCRPCWQTLSEIATFGSSGSVHDEEDFCQFQFDGDKTTFSGKFMFRILITTFAFGNAIATINRCCFFLRVKYHGQMICRVENSFALSAQRLREVSRNLQMFLFQFD